MAISNLLIFGTEGDDSFSPTDFATVYGLGGNDVYFDIFQTLTIIELPGEGTDTVWTAASSYTLPANVEVLKFIYTGASVTGTGNAVNNRIEGTQLGDTLDGGAGRDTMVGGDGEDLYIVDNTLDAIVEVPDNGIDAVEAQTSYTLPANVELLTLASGALNGTGNALDNTITGTDGNNVLRGMAGGDQLIGAGGNDLLDGGDGSDNLLGGLGNDILIGGAGADVMNGQEGNDNLSGGAGDDNLNGGIGKDTLAGGLGNDQFSLGNDGAGIDAVLEAAGQGIDTVLTDYLTYALPANVEVLIADASTSQGVNYTGNTGNNSIYGSEFADQLFGLGGNDFLDGGTDGEADTLNGGLGNDTYSVLTANDRVVELPGQGTDTVLAQTDYMLPDNVENLTLLTFSGASNGWGNAGNNSLQGGTRLEGFAGNDTLEGEGIGAHVLIGGAGNDLYRLHSVLEDIIERANEGVDSAVLTVISGGVYHMALNLEHLQIIAPDGWQVFGNESANRITGTGAVDQLDGGVGTDTLIGGAGNDSYFVDAVGDVITELANQGTDRVFTTVFNTVLAPNVEHVELRGGAQNATGNTLSNEMKGNALANTLNGGVGNDSILGNFGEDTLIGGAGNDTLDGGSGIDVMTGGAGNDLYRVDQGDGVMEALGGGTDTVQSTMYSTNLAVWANVENLTLVEGSVATTGTGNGLNNVITGNFRTNTLTGGLGNDTLVGDGLDTLIGGAGNDTYEIEGDDTTIVENPVEGTDAIMAEFANDFLMPANVENLTMVATENGYLVTGNSLNNVIRDLTFNGGTISGGAGADLLMAGGESSTLIGGPGKDTLVGGHGNETYSMHGDDVGDLVVEAPGMGVDTVNFNGASGAVSYTLPANVENASLTNLGSFAGTLRGNALNNNLLGNGEGGTFFFDGGAGDDTLTVVTSALEASNDTLLGGAGVDFLSASGGNDSLNGGADNDVLQGGAGNDTMIGGTGDDTYHVDSGDGAGAATGEDQVIDLAAQGTDKVVFASETSTFYVLPANVENLQVVIPAIAGTLPGPYSYGVRGNAAANDFQLDGRASVAAEGLAGNDVFRVDTNLTVGTAPGTPELLLLGGDGIDRAEITLNDNLILHSYEVESLDFTVNNISLLSGEGIFDATGITVRGIASLTLPAMPGSTAGGPSYRLENYAATLQLAVSNAASGVDDQVNLALAVSDVALNLANVERLRVSLEGGHATVNGLNLEGVTGLNTLTLTGASSLNLIADVSGIDKIDMENFSGGRFAPLALTPASSQVLDSRMSGSVVTTLDVSGLGTDADIINLEVEPGSVSRLRFIGDDSIDLINVTGSGSLALELNDGDPGGASVQATGFIGTLRATIAPDSVFSVSDDSNGRYDLTGSNFNDVYNLGRALDSLDRINGNSTFVDADADVLSANVTGLSFATGALNITNVETINLAVDAGLDAQLDMQNVTEASVINVTGGSGATFLEVVNARGTWNAATFAGALSVESLDNFNATGGSLDDSLRVLGTDFGGATLNGKGGNDTLAGGNGADTFRFDTALGTTGIDTIEDFDVDIGDVLQLENSIFAALTAGVAPSFLASAGAPMATDPFNLKYNILNGALYYDADAGGAGAAQQIAVVTFGTGFPLLTADDFVVT